MTRPSAERQLRVLMVDAANQSPAYVYPLSTALANEGCAVEIVTAPFVYARIPPPPVPVHEDFARSARSPLVRRSQTLRQIVRGLEYPFDWLRVMRRVDRWRPDIVHIQWAMVPPVDAIAFRSLRRSGARLVYTAHDLRPRYGFVRRVLLSTRRLYRLCDHLIVHTQASQLQLSALAGVPSGRISVIPPGNMLGWSATDVPRAAARQWLGIPNDAPVALFFGIIKPYKGLDTLLVAMRDVLRVLPTAYLVIAGRAEQSFVPYQRLVDELGLGNRVISRPLYIEQADVARYFGATDVVVLPYRESDNSGVMLQAYTFGRPVIVSPVEALADMVDQGTTGVVAVAHGPQALAEALVTVLGDRARTAEMGDRARARADEQHAWPIGARLTRQIYAELVSSRYSDAS
ncbi:MAG: hypothetical protein NVSMB2_12830 [Chloroflexota bacterium]